MRARLTTRLDALEGRHPAGCRVCRGWRPPTLVCVPDADEADKERWPYPDCCPRCGRDVWAGVTVIVGVDWDAI